MKYQVRITDLIHKETIIGVPLDEDEAERAIEQIGPSMETGGWLRTREAESGDMVFFAASRLAHCDVRIVQVEE